MRLTNDENIDSSSHPPACVEAMETEALNPLMNVEVMDADRPSAESVSSGESSSLTVASFDVGRDIQLRAVYYNGQPRIDIRHWPQEGAGVRRPIKKGIPLSLQRWLSLLCYKDTVQKLMRDVRSKATPVSSRIRVSGPVHITVESPYHCVNIREWYMEEEELKAGAKGIVLRFSEWEKVGGADVCGVQPIRLRELYLLKNIILDYIATHVSYYTFTVL